MAYDTAGTSTLRKEVVDALVKQTAERAYKVKTAALAIVSTNGTDNTFFREQVTVPFGQSGNTTAEVPYGASFPQYSIGWEKVTVRNVAHKLEDNIPWEYTLNSAIDIEARTIARLTEGVVKSVDDSCINALCENFTGTGLISSYAITLGRYWSASSAAIIDDIYAAKQLIGDAFYDTGDLICFVSTTDERNVLNYLVGKGAQFPQIATDVVRNGQIGRIGTVSFISTVSMPASYALVVKPKTCATFYQLVPLQSTTVVDPMKSWKVRVVEEGIVGITDPKAICLIKNTKAP